MVGFILLQFMSALIILALDRNIFNGAIESWIKSIVSPICEWICSVFMRSKKETIRPNPFIVSEHYGRMEKAALEILEAQEPIDRIIILWWGLDGLRMNEDGTGEWISRKKPLPISHSNTGVICATPTATFEPLTHESGYLVDMGVDIDNCPQQTLEPLLFVPGGLRVGMLRNHFLDPAQSTQTTIDELQVKMDQDQIENTITMRQQYLLSQMQNCCCNSIIQR